MKNRLTPLIDALTQDTVLKQWFCPLQKALDKVRYPESRMRWHQENAATLFARAFLT